MPHLVIPGSLFHAGLFRIDFPRVDIEQVCVIFHEDPFDTHLKHTERNQPEVGTTAERQNIAEKIQITDRKLVKIIRDPVGNTDLVVPVQGNLAVATVETEGIVTGVVAVAGF
jgi:hypothetical protein